MADKTHDQDVAFIQALAELLRENDLTELHVKREYGETDSLNVRVARHTAAALAAAPAPAPFAPAAPLPPPHPTPPQHPRTPPRWRAR
jgi:acetyl-CoA carboxylase biotin carboxyl carrier protein